MRHATAAESITTRPAQRRLPALLLLIRPGCLYLIRAALTDMEDEVCAALLEDLAPHLDALARAVRALNR